MFSMKLCTGVKFLELWEGGACGENVETVSKGLNAVSLSIGGRCMVSQFDGPHRYQQYRRRLPRCVGKDSGAIACYMKMA